MGKRGDFTDIIVLLDRSSSMSPQASATRESLNGFLDDQKKVPGFARLTLVQFAGPADYHYTYANRPLLSANGLTEFNYSPTGGSTALRDAFGTLIDEVGSRYRSQQESARPEKVIFVVITDAQDNASHKYSAGQIRERVKTQTDAFSWQFIYLGAGHDAIATGANYGFQPGATMTYVASESCLRSVGSTLSSTVSASRTDPTYLVNFTDEERLKAEGK